jgi:hypothetical protein
VENGATSTKDKAELEHKTQELSISLEHLN